MHSLSKKGNVIDILLFIIVIFVLAIAVPIIYYVMNMGYTPLVQEFNASGSNQSVQILQKNQTDYPNIFDAAVVFILIFLWIFILITTFFLDSHPAFFIIAVIIMIFIMIVGIILNNQYLEFASTETYLAIESTFPMTYWILGHIFVIAIIISMSVLVTLYAKSVS